MRLLNVAYLPPFVDGNDSSTNPFAEWGNDASKDSSKEVMGVVIVGSVLKKSENGWKMPTVPTSLSTSNKIMGACQTYVPSFVMKA